ncbi:MAG: hypothetical protein KatS3mg057_1627 [Herpetosiphonaceae bacterium]|nr:MAG: hypothetical protein KatS3mg057_1627 [Herpetosiphonaceae bacterium]
MTTSERDAAIEELEARIRQLSPQARIRTEKKGAEEAIVHVSAPQRDKEAIEDVVRPLCLRFLRQGLDIQVLINEETRSIGS